MSRFHSTLHVLCEEAKWGEVKQIVLSVVSPEKNNNDCGDDSDWNQERLSEALLQQEGPHEWTPLMLSCVRAPLDVIAMLCHAQPKACLIPDKSGSLPIHFCASWRRGPFVDVLYKVLVDAKPESMQVENVWGQTPLHSLLDSKETPPIGGLRIMLAQGEHSKTALQHTDKKKHLPLHTACHKHVPSEYIQALVEAYRDATFVTDGQGNLPCHILHNLGFVDPESMEAVLLPLALGTSRRTSSISTAKPNTMAQLVSLTKQVLSQHGKNSPPMTLPRTPAQVACQTYGHDNKLPIHIAAHHAVKLEIIKGICRQYPDGVAVRVPWGDKEDIMEEKTSVRPEQGGEAPVGQKAIPCILEDTESEEQNAGDVVLDDPSSNEDDTPAIVVHDISILDSPIALQVFATQSLQIPSPPMVENDEPWEEESLNTSPESDTDSDSDEFGEKALKKLTDESDDGALNLSIPALCALEIFEHGRAGKEVEAAIHLQGDPLSGAKSQEVLVDFARRSDLLLSFAPDMVDPMTGNRYIDELDRLRRLERLIRKEARDSGAAPLSDTVSRVWSYLANYNSPPDSRKYIKSVGRIITNLPPSGLWKLTVVSMVDHDVVVQIVCTGRTIVQEAELRAPIARMDHMMKHYWFQYSLTSFLSPLDALNYSVTCRFTRAAGVRLLPQVPLRVTEASWQKPENSEKLSPPKPWQRLDVLVTEDCTHSIFVSYYVECTYVEESELNDHHAFGGMIIVRDDNRKLRPNSDVPWGEAVVAYSEVPAVSGSLVRLSFPHIPGRSYGLWYYNRGEPGSKLNVSDVRIRQLLHSCDEKGRSPLHLLLSKMVDHTPNPRLNLNVSMLLAAKFGSSDSVGDVPLHFALKCGVSEDVLQAIITASPAALVDSDNQGRTPIHAAFLLSKDEPPRLGVIRALLTPPGENAIKLKDWSGRLPIHIAAERGAGGAILKLLVDAYQDGCYRTNDQGDLPLHLLLKSGLATASSVELLIRPMMSNESICRIGGSRGTNLPLHIAAEYQVSFKILERLLQTFGEAAERARVTPAGEGEVEEEPQFALDIVENARGKTIRDVQEEDSADTDDSFSKAKSSAMSDMRNAEFLLRSDLIFVYNPLLINRATRTPYRSDRERIRRLQVMIQREAVQCGDERKINCRAKLSDMAKQGWLFLCTYSNPNDPLDNFAGTVRRILRGLSAHAVDVLAHVENQKSLPTANRMVKDCATPVCKLLIMSRLRFVGRYVLYDEIHPVHKSEACLVMRARDHGLEDEFKRIMQFYDAKEQEVEDDISDAGSETPEPVNNDRPNGVTMATFLGFASKLGVQAKAAKNEIIKLMQLDTTSRPIETRENVSDKATGPEVHRVSEDDESYNSDEDLSVEFNTKPEPEDDDERDIGKEAFSTFCRAHRLAESGVRTVVIKFMKTSKQFHREKDVRKPLELSGTKWSIVPVFDDFNVDRIRESRKRDIHTISYRDEMAEDAIAGAPESKDELYALDIQEKNASVHNFALYKYAVVMPAGDRDLGEISQHEELGILQIREYMIQIGTALQSLHEESTIHGDLKMENVVRFGKSLALIDFDGACHFGPKGKGEKMGGGSSKFCTGILPPEMIYRIDLISEYQKLILYEDYWRRVSEDAKDLNLLTPDDIETITSVTKSLLAKAEVTRNLGKATHGAKTLRDEMNDIYGGLENRNDWKDILSISLITISFEDLPFSLNRCDGVEEFSDVWNRLIFHSRLWKRVKPRITADEKYAFLIKTYNDIPDEFGVIEKPAANQIPYTLVDPSSRIDVWGFGILLYALCAGCSLFHLGFDGDLCYVSNFTDLYEWDKQKSERAIREKIEDPLAQDLLLQILVPAPDRLRSMAEVLRHPFFGSPSNFDAQRILEKHEEQQLIIEETVVINRMTVETRRKVERSMEHQCKIIFDEDKIVVPTCLVILPFKLEFDSSLARNRVIIRSDEDIGAAIKIGSLHLEIMKATARLSFWLAMKNHVLKDNKGILKTRLRTWQKESRSQSPDNVANTILKEIGCGLEYKALCIEMLNEGENVSHSKDYVNDPLTAARRAIEQSTFALTSLYATGQYLYLIDEINGVPTRSDHLTAAGADNMTKTYPILIDPNTSYLPNLFIPFMSLAVMKLTASGGLSALANLLGLPPSYGVPKPWNDGIPGLVHKAERPSTIAEFFVLQDIFRKQQRATMGPDSGLSNDEVEKSGGEMRLLEDFFRDFDPIRTFSDLHRVSDGKEGSSAIWTTESEVSRIQGELELASAEYQLRELKKEWIKKQEIQKAIQVLQKQVDILRDGMPGISTPSRMMQSTNTLVTPKALANGKMPAYPNKSKTLSHTDIKFDPEQVAYDAKAQRERKRPQRKFRPYFGVC